MLLHINCVPLMEDNPSQAIFISHAGNQSITDLSFQHNIESFVMVHLLTKRLIRVCGNETNKRIAEKHVQALQNAQLPDEYLYRFITTVLEMCLDQTVLWYPCYRPDSKADQCDYASGDYSEEDHSKPVDWFGSQYYKVRRPRESHI
jgi:hypothetical protein